MRDLVVASTKFQHKRVHKGTWIIPGIMEKNQIDHMLINKRRLLRGVLSMTGPNCYLDHFLVKARIIQRGMKLQWSKYEGRRKWNCEKLDDDNITKSYRKEIMYMETSSRRKKSTS
jgi:hypothetical protein